MHKSIANKKFMLTTRKHTYN